MYKIKHINKRLYEAAGAVTNRQGTEQIQRKVLSHSLKIHHHLSAEISCTCSNVSSPLGAWFPAPARGSYCFALAESFSLDALPVWHSELPASRPETPSRTSAGEALRSSPLGLSWQDKRLNRRPCSNGKVRIKYLPDIIAHKLQLHSALTQ